jgi:hypothetical protein
VFSRSFLRLLYSNDVKSAILGCKSDIQIFSEEEELKQETKLRVNVNRSQPTEQSPAQSSSTQPGMQNIWTMDVPMEWMSDPANIPPVIVFPEFNHPLPNPHLPTSVTSTLFIQPKSQASTPTTPNTSPVMKMSSALDARLELGVTMEAEWDLKTLQVRLRV